MATIERFPFRPGEHSQTELARRTTDALASIDDMVVSIAVRVAGKRNHADVDDVAQVCRVAVWRKLFNFDSSRASLNTFAYPIARNAALDWARKARSRNIPVDALCELDRVHARDTSRDRVIEQLADDVIARPAEYLPPRTAIALEALSEHDTPEEARISLGLTRSQLYCSTARARHEVRKLAKSVA